MPVLVRIRKSGESFCPIDSVVRLQPLDSCRMRIVDAIQGGLTPSPETLWRTLNRELSPLLFGAGIKDREFVDEIIKTCPEVVNDFTDEQGKDEWHRLLGRGKDHSMHNLACPDLLYLEAHQGAHNRSFSIDVGGIGGFQFRKVFLCSVEPHISAIKRVHNVGILVAKRATG